ncbi:hypothetical protein SCB49_02549 [unidentified eubacterium SCB49]|nr:hypothetical protein SCB49_02549 [unidentified eubacterium SCB49]
MDNPFELIVSRLDSIENLLEKLVNDSNCLTDENHPSKFMTVEELSLYLNLSKGTIYHHTSSRKIPHIRKGKKLYFEKLK